MILTSKSSQVLTLLPQSNQPQYLKFLQQIKPFLLLWKSQHQDVGQGKKVEAPQGKDNNQEKGKGKASDTALSQSERVADPQAPKTKA